jgi:hypothetical protein
MDPRVSQLAKDTFGSVGMSPARGEVAARNFGFQSNEFTWATGQLYESTFNDIPEELRKDVWQTTLARTPGIKNLIGVTKPRAYMMEVSKDLKIQEMAEDMLRVGEFRNLVKSVYWHNIKDESAIVDKLSEYSDKPQVVEEFERMRDFAKKTKDLPSRSYWLEHFHTSVEFKAKNFAELLMRAPASERGKIEDERSQLKKAGYVGEKNWSRFNFLVEEHIYQMSQESKR